jgi:hypothetical protein
VVAEEYLIAQNPPCEGVLCCAVRSASIRRHGVPGVGILSAVLTLLFPLGELHNVVVPPAGPGLVISWNSASLHDIRNAKLGAPVVARALAIVNTCTYDTRAAYDECAVGTQPGGALRRPASERTLANQQRTSHQLCRLLRTGGRAASLGFHSSDLLSRVVS